MGTAVRPEVSDKSEYWVERHRYYELKHFCLQYPIWKKAYEALDGYSTRSACVVETPERVIQRHEWRNLVYISMNG